MHAPPLVQADEDRLTADITTATGRVTHTVAQTSTIAGCGATKTREAIHLGALGASRKAPGGPLIITSRDIARWLIAGRRHALPLREGGAA